MLRKLHNYMTTCISELLHKQTSH